MDERNERITLPSNSREMASRLQSIRDILTSDRESWLSTDEQRAALDAVDSEIADRLNTEREGSTYDSASHRLVENTVNDRYGHLLERHSSTSPSSIARSRRRLNRPLDRIQRQTDRMSRLAGRSDTSEHGLSNISQVPPVQSSRVRQAYDEQDSDLDPHLSRDGKPVRKRRKLDDGTAEQTRPEYGVEGTLLPGNLNMILLDVDGTSDAQSPADQIAKSRLCLPNNRDPYRTQRNNCDVLMKHTGGHPFALSKLVIKLPKRDYDAPPLQGMVFVSMNRETLLSQSSHYKSYFPVSHSHHRRRYDSYRPSVDYMRSTRSPRPTYRPRHHSDTSTDETLWYDSRLSLPEPIEIPSLPGINVNHEAIDDPEGSPSFGPRSPQPWDPDHDYTRRTYMDRYGSRTLSRARELAYVTASELANHLSPTTSEDEEEEDQEHDHDQGDGDDTDEPPLYRGMPPSLRHLQDAEVRQRDLLESQRTLLEQMRVRRDRGDGYSYVPSEPNREEDEDTYPAEQMAAMESTLARRGYDIEALRRRARGPATGANTQSPRPTSPQFYSTKRLPGCTGMLQGQGPHSPSDQNLAAPHAMFSVGRRNGGAVAINFQPEVSGVYILVKLWAMCPNSNVSVQNVLPCGYGTVRQMADIEFR